MFACHRRRDAGGVGGFGDGASGNGPVVRSAPDTNPRARGDSTDPPSTHVSSTEFQSLASARRGRVVRRISVTVIAIFVVAGVFGVWGPRTARTTASSGPVAVALEHASVTRGGLPAPWALTITRTDGAALGDVTVVVDRELFTIFDHNDLVPPPDTVGQDEQSTTWTFDDVTGDELFVELDVRTQPGVRWRQRFTTVVTAADTTVELEASVWVMP